MEKGFLLGLMVACMMENTNMTKSTASGNTFGPMAASTTANGKLVNNMDMAPTRISQASSTEVNGTTENASIGVTRMAMR